MKRADGATSSILLRMPRFAEIIAKGTSSLKTSSAPHAKRLKTGIRRYTDSRENDEREATFPVPKKAICIRKKKKTATRVSARTSGRKVLVLFLAVSESCRFRNWCLY